MALLIWMISPLFRQSFLLSSSTYRAGRIQTPDLLTHSRGRPSTEQAAISRTRRASEEKASRVYFIDQAITFKGSKKE